MFCSKCGNLIPDGAKFCPKCGNPCSVLSEEHKSDDVLEDMHEVSYPKEEISNPRRFKLENGERVILPEEDYDITTKVLDDCIEDYRGSVILTNKAFYYADTDDEEDITYIRVPFCQIVQAVFKKGGRFALFNPSSTEIFLKNEKSITLFGKPTVGILAMAIEDRFKNATVNRDNKYYSKINPKDL